MTISRPFSLAIAVAMLLAWSVPVRGTEDLPPVQVSLPSKILGEKRVVDVYLPMDYNPKTVSKLDVVYILDGDMFGSYASQFQRFAQTCGSMPPVIMVGIHNTYLANGALSRDRDFLPVRTDQFPVGGGADRFLQFLTKELMPVIDQKYPTSGRNTLLGHSYGGLFTAYTLLKEPQAFDSYIASDPALWWNHGYVNALAKKALGKFTKLKRTLFMGGRSGGLHAAMGQAAFERTLKDKAPGNLVWQSEVYANEDHGSVRLKSIFDGLKFTYFGYDSTPVTFFPAGGILLKGKPTRIGVYSTALTYNPGVRYTTDGTEPTPASRRFEFATPVRAPAELKVKLFANRGPDKVVSGRFKLGSTFPTVRRPVGVSPGGFHYAYYEGDWKSLPSFVGLRPKSAGRADDVRSFPGKGGGAFLIEGALEVLEDGYHVFFLDAGGRAKLFIGDQLLIDFDSAHDTPESKSFVVPLRKGFYPVRVEYLFNDGDRRLDLTYRPPSLAITGDLETLPVKIPLRLQYAK